MPLIALMAFPDHQQHAFVKVHVAGRVRAPSVLVYRFPLDTLVSGGHRTTGVALSLGFPAVVLASLAPPLRTAEGYKQALAAARERIGAPLWGAAKACVALPLCWHMLAGARFLLWEWGLHSFDKRATRTTSALVMAGSLAMASGLAFAKFSGPAAQTQQRKQQQKPSGMLKRWLPSWLTVRRPSK